MLFDKCKGSKQLGNIGHAAALFYYSSLGWNVSNPITDCTDYDFLAEDNGKIYKIQVKTTKFLTDSGNYQVHLTTYLNFLLKELRNLENVKVSFIKMNI